MAANIAMIAITTSSSINVKAFTTGLHSDSRLIITFPGAVLRTNCSPNAALAKGPSPHPHAIGPPAWTPTRALLTIAIDSPLSELTIGKICIQHRHSCETKRMETRNVQQSGEDLSRGHL